ncbi:MAG: site-2 protease family protein [Erysipelotrichaceae bacterium]|jgi:regulator of sigma E protease|nr:site-2 protease family protein [Erysipelotrichaceae bacterium]
MEFLGTILNIVIFLLSLSVLVMIHELGHFTAAKIFKVYCSDFSIGFGKAFFHKKRKNGETYFSLRVVPFGGFVAMAEDEGETPEGVVVPKERSINGIRKWKSAIIMASGVTMNFLLAIVLIYCSSQFFPVVTLYSSAYSVADNSPASKAGIISYNIDDKSGDVAKIVNYYYDENGFIYTEDEIKDLSGTFVGPDTIFATSALVGSSEYYVSMDLSSLTLSDLSLQNSNLIFRQKENVDGRDKYVSDSDIKADDKEKLASISEVVINAEFYHQDEEGKPVLESKPISLSVSSGILESIGLTFYKTEHWNSFSEAWNSTFKKFGDGASLIFKSLGDLFTGQNWDNLGGIVAIYSSTTKTLNDMGFGYYLYYWGIISINLGIFNLLPFPGLDGWQLLVLAIEGVSRKKIPDKVKNIVSYIGIGLLFALMIILIFKDIFFPII